MTTAPHLHPGVSTLESRGLSSMRPETPGSSPGGSPLVLTTSECTNKKHLDHVICYTFYEIYLFEYLAMHSKPIDAGLSIIGHHLLTLHRIG